MKLEIPKDTLLTKYMKPIWQWIGPIQNDFAARADWRVSSYKEANHPPIVKLQNNLNILSARNTKVELSAKGSTDPDGDRLTYYWWGYQDASTYKGIIDVKNSRRRNASLTIPDDVKSADTLHIICEVADSGSPKLTRYQRVIITVK